METTWRRNIQQMFRCGASLVVCFHIVVIEPLAAFPKQVADQEIKDAAVGIVRDYVSNWDDSRARRMLFTPSIEARSSLPGITLCRVLEGGSIPLGDGRYVSRAPSHPSQWMVAFDGRRHYRLSGFGTINEFNDLVQSVRLSILNADEATRHMALYLDLVYGVPPKIITSEKELKSAIRAEFGSEQGDASKSVTNWLRGVPGFIRKRLKPPEVDERTDSFILSLYVLTTSYFDSRLFFYRYSVSRDGAVRLLNSAQVNVPYFEP